MTRRETGVLGARLDNDVSLQLLVFGDLFSLPALFFFPISNTPGSLSESEKQPDRVELNSE